jgi:hypothetical protein
MLLDYQQMALVTEYNFLVVTYELQFVAITTFESIYEYVVAPT